MQLSCILWTCSKQPGEPMRHVCASTPRPQHTAHNTCSVGVYSMHLHISEGCGCSEPQVTPARTEIGVCRRCGQLPAGMQGLAGPHLVPIQGALPWHMSHARIHAVSFATCLVAALAGAALAGAALAGAALASAACLPLYASQSCCFAHATSMFIPPGKS